MSFLRFLIPLLATLAAEDPLAEAIRRNTRELLWDRDGMSGRPGAEWLIDAAENAQFVGLAEPHNVKEVPQFTAALFAQLHADLGFDYLALEQGAAVMAAVIRGPDVLANAREYSSALHFRTDQEIELLRDVAALGGARIERVWGLDRELAPERLVADCSGGGASPLWPEALAVGRNEGNVLTLGAFLTDVAAMNGREALTLNLQPVNDKGKFWSLTDYPEYAPFHAVADASKWVIVDLRPLRGKLHAQQFEVSREVHDLILEFDALVLMGGASRGTSDLLGKPAAR